MPDPLGCFAGSLRAKIEGTLAVEYPTHCRLIRLVCDDLVVAGRAGRVHRRGSGNLGAGINLPAR
jgi:hypothetical protein